MLRYIYTRSHIQFFTECGSILKTHSQENNVTRIYIDDDLYEFFGGEERGEYTLLFQFC